jgi:ABC-type branched-subunit amino acid transport system substrate-binding protein
MQLNVEIVDVDNNPEVASDLASRGLKHQPVLSIEGHAEFSGFKPDEIKSAIQEITA